MEKTIDVMEKSNSSKIETQIPAEEKLYRTKMSDDKNKTAADTPLVERKKNYEFGVKESCESEINLSDDFLGFRMALKSIAIKCRK